MKGLSPRPTLVVWDECHWGEHASGGRRLQRWCARSGIPLLGLTATPRPPEVSDFQVACSVDFATLIERGILARPNTLHSVRTRVDWSPERDALLGDFKASSLRELGQSLKRNRLIVEHYVENNEEYRRTLVFACNIEHADRLARMFKDKGVPVGCVHSKRPEPECDADYRAFAQGEIQVLVNVAKLTHGVDIPQVNTIFLCRPTMSDMLFSQMVGRGSRRDVKSGKTTFNIVEFTDNLDRFGDQLRDAKTFFEGSGGGLSEVPIDTRVRPGAKPPVRARHGFDPEGRALWIPDHDSIDDDLRGLWVRDGQTFGIEFELTSEAFRDDMPERAWKSVAETLRRRLDDALPGRVARRVFYEHASDERSFKEWNVERDGSCGWEVTSRILSGPEGFREVIDACRALASVASDVGLRVNHRTGTHVHLGWKCEDGEWLLRLIALVKVFEPAVATLVAPSRIANFDGKTYDPSAPNEYCQPIANVFSRGRVARLRKLESILNVAEEGDNRYVTVNLASLRSKNTVEVRLHNGTLEAGKILLWASLWQQILWAAERDHPIEAVADQTVLTPDGDICALAARNLPAVQQLRFLARLGQRRREVAELWRQHTPLRPWVRLAEAWDG